MLLDRGAMWIAAACRYRPIYRKISACRICGNGDLQPVLDLGVQALSSRFPRQGEGDPPLAPLVMVRCTDCQLVQLQHSVAPGELYTHHYGYRSDTNVTMRKHLTRVAACVEDRLHLKADDIVIDIGCNDGTLLKSYSTNGLRRVGIDPLAEKFRLNTRPTSGFTKDFSRLPPVAASAAENTPRP